MLYLEGSIIIKHLDPKWWTLWYMGCVNTAFQVYTSYTHVAIERCSYNRYYYIMACFRPPTRASNFSYLHALVDKIIFLFHTPSQNWKCPRNHVTQCLKHCFVPKIGPSGRLIFLPLLVSSIIFCTFLQGACHAR